MDTFEWKNPHETAESPVKDIVRRLKEKPGHWALVMVNSDMRPMLSRCSDLKCEGITVYPVRVSEEQYLWDLYAIYEEDKNAD